MVVGRKQTLRMIEQGRVSQIFVAKDADFYVTRHVIDAAASDDIPVKYVESMKQLGHMCGIDIGAAVAGLMEGEKLG